MLGEKAEKPYMLKNPIAHLRAVPSLKLLTSFSAIKGLHAQTLTELDLMSFTTEFQTGFLSGYDKWTAAMGFLRI